MLPLRRLSPVLIMLLLALGLLPAAAQTPSEEDAPILFEQLDLFPEAAVYDPINERFLVTSISEGTIYQIQGDGRISPFIEDEVLGISLGLVIDEARQRVLVANNSSDHHAAGLGAYDLQTGERLFYADFTPLIDALRYIANDVTLDGDGNAYVTDTSTQAIYRVNLEGAADLLVTNQTEGLPPRLISRPNGIVWHPEGYLIVVNRNGLIKVPLDHPEQAATIAIEARIGALDGIALAPNGDLIAADPGSNRIYQLRSEDDFATAVLVGVGETGPIFPTDAFLRGESVYALASYLNQRERGGVSEYGFYPVIFSDPL